MEKIYAIYAVKDIDHYGFVDAEWCDYYPAVDRIFFTHDIDHVMKYNSREIEILNDYLRSKNYNTKIINWSA